MDDGQSGEPMVNVTNHADGERNIDIGNALTLNHNMAAVIALGVHINIQRAS